MTSLCEAVGISSGIAKENGLEHTEVLSIIGYLEGPESFLNYNYEKMYSYEEDRSFGFDYQVECVFVTHFGKVFLEAAIEKYKESGKITPFSLNDFEQILREKGNKEEK